MNSTEKILLRSFICCFIVNLFCFVNIQTGFSQQMKYEPENILIHFDKSYYLAGETLHFKIYFLNEDTLKSNIVHLDLIDSTGKVLMNQILEIEKNQSSGSYDIPYNFTEGNYLFRCYTRWNLNFGPSGIFYQVIPVYNEFLGISDIDQMQGSTSTFTGSFNSGRTQNLQMIIEGRGSIGTNEKVKLEIFRNGSETNPETIRYSIAVVEKSCLTDPAPDPLKDGVNTSVSSATDSTVFQAEDSITIRGYVQDPKTGAPISSRVLSVYNVKKADFTRLISRKGDFEFKLPLFQGTTDLQIINMNPYQQSVPDVTWIPLNKELPPDPVFRGKAIRSDEVKEYILYSRLRNKISEIFYKSSYDSIQLQEPPLLPFSPDRSYDMSKYQLIRDVFDFFREGVTNTNFYRENGREKFRLFNAEKKNFFMTSPWFIVDGHFIFNDSLVHHIPFNHLRRIDIYNTNESIFKYFEPIMIQGGVVAIYTKNNFLIDYIRSQPNTLTVHGVPEAAGDLEVDIRDASDDSHETPDFDPLLFWDPDVRTDDLGKAMIEFYTNDMTGTFIIRVQGMDENGNPLYGQTSFEVIP